MGHLPTLATFTHTRIPPAPSYSAGGTQRLPRIIGMTRAKELIYTAKVLGPDGAKEYGE